MIKNLCPIEVFNHETGGWEQVGAVASVPATLHPDAIGTLRRVNGYLEVRRNRIKANPQAYGKSEIREIDELRALIQAVIADKQEGG
jgi:hypothetical protein